MLFVSFFFSCHKLKDYFPNPHEPEPMAEFNNVFGGTHDDIAYATVASPDGGYLMVGSTYSNDGDVSGNHGQGDAWVVKLDKSGTKAWQKAYGGSNMDNFRSVTASADGGYLLAGVTQSNDGDVSGNHDNGNVNYFDAWVVKIDKAGTLIWQKTLGGSKSDHPYAITATSDGGYVLAGWTTSNDGDVSGFHGGSSQDAWVVKLDKDGNTIWGKAFGGTRIDEALSIVNSSDGGYVMAGLTTSNNGDVSGNHGNTGTFDAWVVKLSKEGNLIWQKTLGGTAYDAILSIIRSGDNGYVLAGMTRSNNGDVSGNHGGERDAWVLKLDESGNLIWQKTLGGSGVDMAASIVTNLDGGYTMAGFTSSNNGDVSGKHGASNSYDAWVVKLEKNGTKVWQKALGGSMDDNASSILTRADGSYVMAGVTYSNDGDMSGNHGNSDFWLLTIKDK